MEQIATKQYALEEQMADLSMVVRGVAKGSLEENSRDTGSGSRGRSGG